MKTTERNYHSGLAAEDIVERLYVNNDHTVVARRWRGGRGELDVVVEKDGQLIFVEVKQSKTFADAAWRMTATKVRRLVSCATAFLAKNGFGLATDCRFDLALVDGTGRVELIENAIVA